MKIDFEKPKELIHEEVFVDREEQRQQFWNIFEELCERKEQWTITVFHFWGMGGIGKSSLLKKLYQEITDKNSTQKDKIPSAFVSLSNRENDIQILCRLVNLLKKQSNYSFPLFEVGMYWLYQKSGNGEWKKEIQSLEEKSVILSGILDFASAIPIASVITGSFRLFDKSMKALRNHFSAHQKELLYLEDKFSEEIEEILPGLFAKDLEWNTGQFLYPTVIFLDKLDVLRTGISGIDAIDYNEKWLKEMLVEKVPNVIWVFSGREKLFWDEKEPGEWAESLYNIKVDEFSKYWLGQYFSQNGAKLSYLEAELYALTKGIPLYLNICCELYQKFQKEEKIWNINDFEGKQEVLLRTYVDNLSPAEMKVLFILSCLGEWNQELIQYVWSKIPGEDCFKAYDVLKKKAYISINESICELHQVIQEQIFAFCTDDDVKQVADILKQYMPTDCYSEWYPIYLRCRMKLLKTDSEVEDWYFSEDLGILKKLIMQNNVNGFERCYREIRNQLRGRFDDSQIYIIMTQFHIRNLLQFKYVEQAKQEANYMIRVCKASKRAVSQEFRNVTSNFFEMKAQALDGQRKFQMALKIRKGLCSDVCYVRESDLVSRIHNLAASYLQMKDYDQALKLTDRVLVYREAHMQESPEDYVRALVLKMDIYKERYSTDIHDQESVQKMLEAGRRAVQESELLLGEDHYLTMETESAIGIVLSELREWELALEFLISARNKLFRLNHGRNELIDELDFRIAVASAETGDTKAAIELLDSLQDVSKSYQEGADKFIYRCDLEKGISLSKEGKHAEAEKLLKNAWKSSAEKFGPEDILTLELAYATAIEEYFLKNYENCLDILENISSRIKQHWGNNSHFMYFIKTLKIKCGENNI